MHISEQKVLAGNESRRIKLEIIRVDIFKARVLKDHRGIAAQQYLVAIGGNCSLERNVVGKKLYPRGDGASCHPFTVSLTRFVPSIRKKASFF